MPSRIEDYAVIGNCETVALVGRDGSIDWLCCPRFDAAACFAALLGAPEHGRWLIAATASDARISRRYRPGTLTLETDFETPAGSVRVTDCMTRRDGGAELIRLVHGLRGEVAMVMELIARFEYGMIVPWVSQLEDGRLSLVAGAEQLILDAPVVTHGEGLTTRAEFAVAAGQTLAFSLGWQPSYRPPPPRFDVAGALEQSSRDWATWSAGCQAHGRWAEPILRSLITLKALTHHKTGGIVAAATTSLPEHLGGSRNWDYRYCWLRDSTFTLQALLASGFHDEAHAWREWLVRAVAGSPDQMQIMYGVAGERRLNEFDLPQLPGYAASSPVRIGNAAAGQVQLDVYGEVLDSLYQFRRKGIPGWTPAWDLETALVEHVALIWNQPDDGIWEMRGGPRHFTHSKVMAWVALDRAIRSCEEFDLGGATDRWRELRQTIHDEVCREGFNVACNSFVQFYGSTAIDASLLLIPLVGFLPPDDPRVQGTIVAVETQLMRNGLVSRYDTYTGGDGLPPGEGVFLACSFWLADNYVLQNRIDDATHLFERLLALCNDVGLISEEYDPIDRRLLGNFPQAFSHVALINTALNLSRAIGPAHERAAGD